MSASKLSNSFSSSELGRINSYREQRMLIRPISSHAQSESLGVTARNDLESIQQCLKNTILKRKESLNRSQDQMLLSDPFDKVINQLDQETSLNSTRPTNQSPEPQSPTENARHKNFSKYAMFDSTLNVIEQHPQPAVKSSFTEKTNGVRLQYRQNRQNAGGSRYLQSNGNINKNVVQRVKSNTAQQFDMKASMTASQSSTINNSTSIRTQPVKQQLVLKKEEPKGVPKHECIKISKKVEQLKEQISRMPFRRRAEMESSLQQLLEMLRDHQ